jgi:hypothetical protein
MTYLQLVNDVLIRLRESEVTSVNDTTYSKLIAKFVNDAKRTVEDAYSWSAFETTISLNTVADTQNYALTGVGKRFKVIDAVNTTNKSALTNISALEMSRFTNLSDASNTIPTYYSFKGLSSSGDIKVDLYPIPNAVYALKFEVVIPQADLTANSDVMSVPSDPVIYLAFAKALAERGEDGGMASSEAAQLYRQALADAIAIESSRQVEHHNWVAV